MAYDVSAKLETRIAHKDLKVDVKTIVEGEQSTLGTLLISKGSIEWRPGGKSVNRKSLRWDKFAALIEEQGRAIKKARR